MKRFVSLYRVGKRSGNIFWPIKFVSKYTIKIPCFTFENVLGNQSECCRSISSRRSDSVVDLCRNDGIYMSVVVCSVLVCEVGVVVLVVVVEDVGVTNRILRSGAIVIGPEGYLSGARRIYDDVHTKIACQGAPKWVFVACC